MSRPDMNNAEAIDMMERCKEEIRGLRQHISHLQPKADAYDNIARILCLLPRSSEPMGEDMVWRLEKRIRELQTVTADTESTV